jgi:hypothetical protein
MSRNGSGVYSLPAGNPVVTGTTISSSWANTTLSDIATALTGSVAADGQTAMTGNLQMGNNKVTGLAVASATGDALSYNQAATVTTLTTTGNVTIGGTLTLTGGLTLNGNVTVGDSSSDTLTVNATSTFAAGATFSSTFAANGGATLGDASGDALTINSSAVSIPNGLNFDSNTLVIDATNDRVGIGTSSPSGKLDVVLTDNGNIDIRQNASASTGFLSWVDSDGDRAGRISYDHTTNALRFATAASGTGTERMRIDSSGNVGIGTSSPSVKLDVLNTAASTTNIRVQNASASSGAYAQFRLDSDAATAYFGVSGSGNTVNGGLYDGDFVYLGTENTAGGLNIGAGSGQAIKFYTGGSATANVRATLDSSGNLGIGVTPSAWTSGYKAIDLNTYGAISSSTTALRIWGNCYQSASDYTYKTTSEATLFDTAGGSFRLYTAPSGTAGTAISWTQILNLNTSGNLALSGGTTSANGVGITFPATQQASSNANCLDDYEEGSFTPNIAGLSAAGTATYSERYGKYTKVGNRCNFQIWLNWTNLTGATGALVVTGLPFTSVGTTGGFANASVYMDSAITLSANYVIQGYVLASNTIFYFSQYATGGSNAAALSIDTSAAVMITGSYEVA